jgi:hypothetical protein
MQFLEIPENMTLAQLSERVGARNVDAVLQYNSVQRTHAVGEAYNHMVDVITSQYTEVDHDSVSNTVSYRRRVNVLNTFIDDSDVFEAAALQNNDGWILMSTIGTIPGYLRIPPTITLPDSTDILGGTDNPVDRTTYRKAMTYLQNDKDIDPVIFNTYSDRQSGAELVNNNQAVPVYQWFKIPWGEITLYSSLSDTAMDFPVYPEEYSDERKANYDTMPEMLYQYEPWQVYKSSGPRDSTYTFKFHRDMWTGDHRDGKANELIRFCEANCYAQYSGSVVNTAKVTLYIAGKALISGIMTSVKVNYSGPVGLDNMPLYVELSISITEVSDEPLNYESVMRKGLIG